MIVNVKKIINILMCFIITMIFTAMMTSPIHVYATEMKNIEKSKTESFYTIKIKSGDVATFKKSMGGILSPDKKTITFYIVENGRLPNNLPSYKELDVDKNHYILDSSIWGFKKNVGKVTRDETIVVQYGTLINGVEYTVAYQDKLTGKNIAPPKIMRGNEGDSIKESYLNIKYYKLKGSESQSLKLDKEIPDNKIVFLYDYVGLDPIISYQTEKEDVVNKTYVDQIQENVPQYISTPVVGNRTNNGGLREVASSLKSSNEEKNGDTSTIENNQSNVTSMTDSNPVRFGIDKFGNMPAIVAIAILLIFGLFTIVYRITRDKKNKLRNPLQESTE